MRSSGHLLLFFMSHDWYCKAALMRSHDYDCIVNCRVLRQIFKSIRQIVDVLFLLIFFIVLFALFGMSQ